MEFHRNGFKKELLEIPWPGFDMGTGMLQINKYKTMHKNKKKYLLMTQDYYLKVVSACANQ
jgi:hypothetical protein